YHTRLWQTGEIIFDEWRIIVPKLPPGTYEIRAGMYDASSGKRLPIMQNGDLVGEWIKLTDFQVKG
ncbi:MAG TPA: hypothetical protein VKQ72_11660, partial [Aggregatilineales bacterium]|nr:hypothetical protein [Aggregatilineales bacterium]